MEVDRVPEPLADAEAAGHALDALNLCVGRFTARVRRSEHDGVDDTVEVFAGSPAPLVGGFRASCPHFPGGGERRAGTGGAAGGTPSSDSTPLLVHVLGGVLPSEHAWGTRPEASTPAQGPRRAIRPPSSGIRPYTAHPAPGSPTKGAGEPKNARCPSGIQSRGDAGKRWCCSGS